MKRLRSGFIIIALLLAWTSWAQEKGAKIRVAIYQDTGTTTKGPINIEKCLQDQPDFSYAYVKAEDIRGGALAKYDVVVLPGGGAASASKTLGEEGLPGHLPQGRRPCPYQRVPGRRQLRRRHDQNPADR
jgi:hypothetical protein